MFRDMHVHFFILIFIPAAKPLELDRGFLKMSCSVSLHYIKDTKWINIGG